MDDPAGSLRAGVLMTETTIELFLIISIVALVCAVLGPIVLFVVIIALAIWWFAAGR